MYLATDVWYIYIARFIAGIGAGGYFFTLILKNIYAQSNLYFDLFNVLL